MVFDKYEKRAELRGVERWQRGDRIQGAPQALRYGVIHAAYRISMNGMGISADCRGYFWVDAFYS